MSAPAEKRVLTVWFEHGMAAALVTEYKRGEAECRVTLQKEVLECTEQELQTAGMRAAIGALACWGEKAAPAGPISQYVKLAIQQERDRWVRPEPEEK